MVGLAEDKRRKLMALISIMPPKALNTLTMAVELGMASGDTSLPYKDLLAILKPGPDLSGPEAQLTVRMQEVILPFVSDTGVAFAKPITKANLDALWPILIRDVLGEVWSKMISDFAEAAAADERGDGEGGEADDVADAANRAIASRLHELLAGSPKALKKIIPTKDMVEAATSLAGLCDGTKPLRKKLRELPASFEIRTPDDVSVWRRHYEDLSRVSSEAALQFFCMAVSRMPRPSQVFKVVSEAAGGRSERFVSETELSAVGGFIAVKAEELLVLVDAFNPCDDPDQVKRVVSAVDHFNLISIDLEAAFGTESKGPWSVSITKMCASLSRRMEDYFKDSVKTFDQAFPSDKKQLLPRVFAVIPRVKMPINETQYARAVGYAHFIAGLRHVSSALGFGTSRQKVAADLEKKAEEYANNLVDMLRDEDVEDKEIVRTYIEGVATFLAALVGEETAGLLRRRAAA